MFLIRLAELNIAIHNRYNYIKNICTDYITVGKKDFEIHLTEQEIEAERKAITDKAEYLESLAVYRKIADKIISYNGFLMHAAIIKHKDTAVAFLAKSGIGKTTHLMLWKNLLEDEIQIINGDKPLIRIIDGKIYAFGTPWCGKEALNENTFAELKKVCFIERAEKNCCTSINNKQEIFERLLTQLYRPKQEFTLKSALGLVNTLINSAEFYLLKCNTDISAAEEAYKTLFLVVQEKNMNDLKNEYEFCIICKKKLDVLRSTPIDIREYYVFGAGQMCSECYHSFVKHLNDRK